MKKENHKSKATKKIPLARGLWAILNDESEAIGVFVEKLDIDAKKDQRSTNDLENLDIDAKKDQRSTNDLERLSGLEQDKALAEKLNSLKFCHYHDRGLGPDLWMPLKQISRNEIQALNLGSKIRFKDFNEKTLSKLISGEVSAILMLECSNYSCYVPGSAWRSPTSEDIQRFVAGDAQTGLGELVEPTIATFGGEISAEDVSELGIGHALIEIYQNVTELMVKIIDKWMNDQEWQEYHYEDMIEEFDKEDFDDILFDMGDGQWRGFNTNQVLVSEIGAVCDIESGGFPEGKFGVHSLGYSLNSHDYGTRGKGATSEELKFAITSTYYMNDKGWDGTVYFANPQN